MIYRKTGFEVMYQLPEGWQRAPVKELHFATDGSGYDEAITADGKTVQLQPVYTALLEFTGQFDRNARPIFHGDILADDEGSIWEVVFVECAFSLRQDETVEALTNAAAMYLHVVGDAIRDAKLLIPSNATDVLEAAEKSAEGTV